MLPLAHGGILLAIFAARGVSMVSYAGGSSGGGGNGSSARGASGGGVVCGAEPLFLQDYIAIGKVVPEHVADIVSGIAEGIEDRKSVV